jgi:carbohydrate diacid regulator
MSNRLFQNVIHQTRDVIGRTVGVIDENGIIVACSDISKIGESRQRIREELTYSGEVVVYERYTYRFFTPQNKVHSIVFVEGDDSEADKAALG